MESYQIEEAAGRAGTTVAELNQMVELGIVSPATDGRFSKADLRRVGLVGSLVAAGMPLEGLGAAIGSGQVSFDFLDAPTYERFSAFSNETFAQRASRNGAPLELLMRIREAAGFAAPQPDDRMRDEELPYAEMVELALSVGFRPSVLQQMMRVQSDSLRRMAETEAASWNTEVIAPAIAAGKRADEIYGVDFAVQMGALLEQSVIGMYHLQQSQAWGASIIEGLEMQLAAAGLHSRLEHPPAMCFLDITGYTRLTQEKGDAAAADLAERLGRLVQRSSVSHGGRPVKWLGDGVMLFYPSPGRGVMSALEMVAGISEAGLPPAHVGLHAGPVIFQEGDYYGATVNMASRIAEYARPGEVLVSQEVVDAATEPAVAFRDIGPVELKGVAGATHLHAASQRV